MIQAERAGYIISGAAHAGLFATVLLAGIWQTAPEPIEFTSVTLLSAADFAQNTAPAPQKPQTQSDPPKPPKPSPVETPRPPAPAEAPLARADRIAPVPTPAPADNTPTADTETQALAPDPDALPSKAPLAPVNKAPTPTAPKIVPEAPKDAVLTAAPPKTRPAPPQAIETEQDSPESDQLANQADTNDQPANDAQTSEPLSSAQTDGFLREVGACWNLGATSSAALRTKVTIRFDLNPDGTIVQGSMQMVGYEGGDNSAAQIAYRQARSAIFRCQKRGGRAGYSLPSDQYDQWKTIELIFNPDKMRAL